MSIRKFCVAMIFTYALVLTGCSSTCSTCDYAYTYNSRCGLPSCTDNTYLVDVYSNPCPGPYNCDVY